MPAEEKEHAAGGGALETELCRLRDELKRTAEGRQALAELIEQMEKG